jgi:opacity protein-like surface antigen
MCAAAVLAALLVSSRAGAFERQWHLGADAGWSVLTWKGSVHGGFGGGAHLTYGLTDSFNAVAELSVTGHPLYVGRPWMTVGSGAAGLAYTLDVLRWVPYAALLVGGYQFSGANLQQAEYKLGFQLALGFDYAFSRSWAAGLQVRYHTFSDDPFTAHYLTTFARFEYRWGW